MKATMDIVEKINYYKQTKRQVAFSNYYSLVRSVIESDFKDYKSIVEAVEIKQSIKQLCL